MTKHQPIPITRPTLPSLAKIRHRVEEILDTGQLTNGKYVRQFEKRFADAFGIKHAVALSSCTDGLIWTMKYLPAGEIILPSFTFCATGNAAHLAGHTLVFSDCDRATFNLDPAGVEARITNRTRAIIATYIYGNPPDIGRLKRIAAKYDVKLILDAAHAAGAKYRGHCAGTQAWAEVFSLTPTKTICCGEGGMVATKDSALAEFLKLAREYGNPGDYNTQFIGSNARMEEFNAILGIEGLKQIERFVVARNEIARRYRASLSGIDGISFPSIAPGDLCSFKDFTILINAALARFSRDQLLQYLAAHGVGSRRYFSPPLHRQKAFVDLGFDGADTELVNTEFISDNCLSLPMFSHLTKEQQDRVIRLILSAATKGCRVVVARD